MNACRVCRVQFGFTIFHFSVFRFSAVSFCVLIALICSPDVSLAIQAGGEGGSGEGEVRGEEGRRNEVLREQERDVTRQRPQTGGYESTTDPFFRDPRDNSASERNQYDAVPWELANPQAANERANLLKNDLPAIRQKMADRIPLTREDREVVNRLDQIEQRRNQYESARQPLADQNQYDRVQLGLADQLRNARAEREKLESQSLSADRVARQELLKHKSSGEDITPNFGRPMRIITDRMQYSDFVVQRFERSGGDQRLAPTQRQWWEANYYRQNLVAQQLAMQQWAQIRSNGNGGYPPGSQQPGRSTQRQPTFPR